MPLKPQKSNPQQLASALKTQIIEQQQKNVKLEAENITLKAKIVALTEQLREKGPFLSDLIIAASDETSYKEFVDRERKTNAEIKKLKRELKK